MLFWTVAALLTLAASLAVLMPLARRRDGGTDATRNEIEVYRDQLGEVDRDTKRGLLNPQEAEQARAEIGRRIIKADAAGQTAKRGGFSGIAKYVAAAGVLAVPLISWGLYAEIGAPQLPGQPLAGRIICDPAKSSIEELVACAERQLAQNPNDQRGWEILGPIYVRLTRYDDALDAYRNVIRIGGPTPARQAAFGEALVYVNGGLITADARKAFDDALKGQPGYPKARFFLAMAKAQEGKQQEAVAEWQDMASNLPENDPWRGAAQRMLAETESAPAQGGPDASQIEQMVAGLDQRLRDNPNDVEGWKRLVRSYVVLGKQDQARDALSRALTALGADSAAGKDIGAFAAGQGVKIE